MSCFVWSVCGFGGDLGEQGLVLVRWRLWGGDDPHVGVSMGFCTSADFRTQGVTPNCTLFPNLLFFFVCFPPAFYMFMLNSMF